MTNQEVAYIVDAINQVTANAKQWGQDYKFNHTTGDFEYADQDVEFPNLAKFSPL
jgi:hypothetical protein